MKTTNPTIVTAAERQGKRARAKSPQVSKAEKYISSVLPYL
jgi:hypothetical protein